MGSAIGFFVGILTTILAALFGGRDIPTSGLVLLTAPVVAVAAITTLAGALAAAAQCWALWDGFLVNGLGRLGIEHGGWQGLALLMGCAAMAHLTGVTGRHLAARRRTPPQPLPWGSIPV